MMQPKVFIRTEYANTYKQIAVSAFHSTISNKGCELTAYEDEDDFTPPDVPSMLLQSVNTALITEVVWPRLSDAIPQTTIRASLWFNRQWLMHSESDRQIFLQVFEELGAANAEAAIDKNLAGYPT